MNCLTVADKEPKIGGLRAGGESPSPSGIEGRAWPTIQVLLGHDKFAQINVGAKRRLRGPVTRAGAAVAGERLKDHAVDVGFEMEVRRAAEPAAAGQADLLPGFYLITHAYGHAAFLHVPIPRLMSVPVTK